MNHTHFIQAPLFIFLFKLFALLLFSPAINLTSISFFFAQKHDFRVSLFLSLQVPDCSRPETLNTEHPSLLEAVTDTQQTVGRILEIARVLFHLDQVNLY